MRVDGVRSGCFGLCDEVLVEEELADMIHIATAMCAIRIRSAVEVSKNMNMCCTAGILVMKERLEYYHTVGVYWVKTAKKSCIEIFCVRGIAIA